MCLKTFFEAPIKLQSMMDPGRAFYSFWAAILKARSPKPLNLLRGTADWLEPVEWNVQMLVLFWSISLMYSGTWSCKVRYTKSSTLKSILFSTGSQCNAFSTWVIWSNFFVPINNLAGAFCIHCMWLKLKIRSPNGATLWSRHQHSQSQAGANFWHDLRYC